MKRIVCFVLILNGILLFTQCKSHISYTKKSETSQPYREIPYQHFTQKKKTQSVAVLLPDNPDTLKIAQSAITQFFKKEGFDIIIITKPGIDRDSRISMDTRDGRIQDIIAVFRKEIINQYENTVLLGIGEGGYLVPALRNELQPTKSFAINITPYSPLAAYEGWVDQDSLSPHQWQIMHLKNLISQDELHEKIAAIRSKKSDIDLLAPNSNRQWMSYYENPALYALYRLSPPFFWINFNQHPMISAAHQKEAALYCQSLSAPYISIPGKGNLNDEDQMDMLIKELDKILSDE